MKRTLALILGLMLLMTHVVYAKDQCNIPKIDTSKINKGVVSIQYNNKSHKKEKVIIEKDNSRYIYTLHKSKEIENFPLQMGRGPYKVVLLENVKDNKYKPIISDTFQVSLTDKNQVFLQSVQGIEWNESMDAIIMAGNLTDGLINDEEKVKAIYEYIVSNIKYDFTKKNKITSDYLPQIDEIYQESGGICYDFSSIMAGMLRSVGIPAKLIKGYSKNATSYHSWNEVYINDNWIVMDASYDSQMKARNKNYSMIKNPALYEKKYEY
ncbi:MAG: transglutaminase-like domain-containing protein [Eubacteriales bacterium]|nr:transglutaminase-like domain-containing protein [Eubacteriales bacterium]